MGQQANEMALRTLRLNLQRAAAENYRRQEVCPPAQTDKRRGHMSHTDRADTDINANFDQNLYMFPPAYNELRRELYENWQDTVWPLVAWRMAYKAEEFCEVMNAVTGLALAPDSDAVDWTCERYLRKMRQMRGLKY